MALKAFVWNRDFLTDWSSGIGVVVAENVEQAREIGKAEMIKCHSGSCAADFDPEPDYICDLDKPSCIAIEYGGS